MSEPSLTTDETGVRLATELLGLVATRLHRDHSPRPDGDGCAACDQPWPCSGRRLAELALRRAGGH